MVTQPGVRLKIAWPYGACGEGAMCPHAVQVALVMLRMGNPTADTYESDDHRLRCGWPQMGDRTTKAVGLAKGFSRSSWKRSAKCEDLMRNLLNKRYIKIQ